MSYRIREHIQKTRSNPAGVSVILHPDRPFNSYGWRAPIAWSGFVDGEAVSFVQVTADVLSDSSFNWEGFPAKFTQYKSSIIELIENELGRLN